MGRNKGAVKSFDNATSKGIVEDKHGNEYEFEQPDFEEMGMAIGDTIRYTDIAVVAPADPDEPAGPLLATKAIALTLINRGRVETIDVTNGTGTIKDKSKGGFIDFVQPNLTELEIEVGTRVRFRRHNGQARSLINLDIDSE